MLSSRLSSLSSCRHYLLRFALTANGSRLVGRPYSEIHPREWVIVFRSFLKGTHLQDLPESTNCRWWDSGTGLFSVITRSGNGLSQARTMASPDLHANASANCGMFESGPLLANVDPTRVPKFAYNGPLSNMPQFAEAVCVQVRRRHGAPEKDRCQIW